MGADEGSWRRALALAAACAGACGGDDGSGSGGDPSGNPRWVTTLVGAPETNQVGRAVTIGPERRVWVAGGVDQGVDGRDAYVARLAP